MKEHIYSFEFPGTREAFLKRLDQYPNNNHTFFYFNDFIVKVSGEQYDFGVARGGHSGGYWFKPNVSESDGKLIFSGMIEYIDDYSNEKVLKKVKNKVAEYLLLIPAIPIILLFELYFLIRNLIRRIKKQVPIIEEKPEDKLLNLMTNFLGCTEL